MILGKHVSIAGGLDKAVARAKEIGCNSLQIFVKNPRGWRARNLTDEEVNKFKQKLSEFNFSPLVVHATYLINLASPKEDLWEKSIDGLITDYSRSGRIGADYLVVHPGSHTGDGLEDGIKRISKAINDVLAQVENGTLLLLENVAGAGSSIGASFEQLQQILDNIVNKERVGICLDTCHAFAAGYDLHTKSGLDKMLTQFDEIIGLDKLRVIHLNDSRHDIGTNKDEHAHIGEGDIGKEAVKAIINHSKLKDKPFILETPWFDELPDEDVVLLKKMRN